MGMSQARDAWLISHASSIARLALGNIQRPYPYHLVHMLDSDSDLMPPRDLHPIFYGSYDWHSSVHMHWLLARLMRHAATLPQTTEIATVFDQHFCHSKVEIEIDYFQRASNRTFERPYGWAWLLKLQAELNVLKLECNRALPWAQALQPLADLLVQRTIDFLSLTQYPVRAGTHANSAFSLLFMLQYARAIEHRHFEQIILDKAKQWFGADKQYPAAYEPGGDDFLSTGLLEAVLMHEVLDREDFLEWWLQFCPAAEDRKVWLAPVPVLDRSDPKLAHLDGLNLSRAWCWGVLRDTLPPAFANEAQLAIDAHLAMSLPAVVEGDYAGTHWLASFACLALSETTKKL